MSFDEIDAARFSAETINIVYEEVQRFLAKHPQASAADVVDHVGVMVSEMNRTVKSMKDSIKVMACKNCGYPIEWRPTTDKWRHRDADKSVGCRAASFEPGEGWNEEIPKTWKAQPFKA